MHHGPDERGLEQQRSAKFYVRSFPRNVRVSSTSDLDELLVAFIAVEKANDQRFENVCAGVRPILGLVGALMRTQLRLN
jgi:hypothetical protein